MWVLDGWMTYDFTSFSTVFLSCQSDVRVIMKDYVQWNLIHEWLERFPPQAGFEPGTTRLVGQRLTR